MELFDRDDIKNIDKDFGAKDVIDWKIQAFSDKLMGYLGEHLKLIVFAEENGIVSKYNFFVKCIPLSDKWKADYIRGIGFFKKEFMMLSRLFQAFGGDDGPDKWRPRLFFVKEELFVFEDLTTLGYSMPDHTETLSFNEIVAVVKAVAKFHAQTYIYEEKQSKEQQKVYRLWEDFSEYLKEPLNVMSWRTAGMNAAIDLLKKFSKHKSRQNFGMELDTIVPALFNKAINQMKPNSNSRNAVVHRDLWPNNIFLKEQKDDNCHAILIDYQTILYTSPMVDLSSLIYFNTTRNFRESHFGMIFDIYYSVMARELSIHEIDISVIFSKKELMQQYEQNVVFGITQAALIVPIIALTDERRNLLFCDPETCERMNEVSRSEELIAVALEDDKYKERVMDLLDEIVEEFICVNDNVIKH